MAANVRRETGEVAFDFLVGYQEKKRLEGLVPATMIGAEVPVDRPLEILATLRFADGALSMDCIAIHEMARGDPPEDFPVQAAWLGLQTTRK